MLCAERETVVVRARATPSFLAFYVIRKLLVEDRNLSVSKSSCMAKFHGHHETFIVEGKREGGGRKTKTPENTQGSSCEPLQ